MTPIPIQRKRNEPYPECGVTLTVTRPTVFGNPFVITKIKTAVLKKTAYEISSRGSPYCIVFSSKEDAQRKAVELFREYLDTMKMRQPEIYAEMIRKVREADYVACWCPVTEPDNLCHRSVWIEMAAEIA